MEVIKKQEFGEEQFEMKKIRIAALLLAAALVASAFAGCGETKAQTSDKTPPEQGQQQDQKQPRENGRGTMAKVVSLDGDQLTVILADIRGGNGPAPSNDGSGPAPASGPAVDSSGAPADQPGQDGQGGGKIQFTGEQDTYTLSKDVKIAKGAGDDAAGISLSELAADDVISFTTTAGDDGGDVINSITVLDRVN
jgi:hypothetical protein